MARAEENNLHGVAPGIEAETRRRIERAIRRARLVLLWEAVWPVVAPMLVLAGLFAVVSWFGLWRVVADPVRIAALVGFAVAAVWLAIRAVRLRAPARAAALLRVEQATGMLHRPATAFTDTIAVGANDPAAQALWLAHRERLLAALDTLKAGLPSPGLARRDPWAIRFLAILLFIVGFVYAGPERSRQARRSLSRRRAGCGHRRPHRRVGDAARLYLAPADLPHRRRRAAVPAPNIRCPWAASSPSGPAAPTISRW